MEKKKIYTSLGVRYNNPLCIRHNAANRWQGSNGVYNGFVKFITPVYGYRAAAYIVLRYFSFYGLRTIYDIVNRWAPATDGNRPKVYANLVYNNMMARLRNVPLRVENIDSDIVKALQQAEAKDFPSRKELFFTLLENLLYSMSVVECGLCLLTDQSLSSDFAKACSEAVRIVKSDVLSGQLGSNYLDFLIKR